LSGTRSRGSWRRASSTTTRRDLGRPDPARAPLGPCHWGIGSRFLQVEFPFLRYSLVYYVYVLSFFRRAQKDERLQAALEALASKLDEGGWVVVEHRHRALARLAFCARGEPAAVATRRFAELRERLA